MVLWIEDGRVADAQLLQQPGRRSTLVLCIHTEHIHRTRVCKTLQPRHFRATGGTPAGPDIHRSSGRPDSPDMRTGAPGPRQGSSRLGSPLSLSTGRPDRGQASMPAVTGSDSSGTLVLDWLGPTLAPASFSSHALAVASVASPTNISATNFRRWLTGCPSPTWQRRPDQSGPRHRRGRAGRSNKHHRQVCGRGNDDGHARSSGAKHRPLSTGEEGAYFGLDLVRVGLGGPSEPSSQPTEARSNGDPWNTEGISHHNVRRLPADPERSQGLSIDLVPHRRSV